MKFHVNCLPADNSDEITSLIVLENEDTVQPNLSGLSKIDKTKVLKTDGSLMQVKSIAESSLNWSLLQYF